MAGTSSHAVIYERPSMEVEAVEGNRRRSSSDPLRLHRPAIAVAGQSNQSYMPKVHEDSVFTGTGGVMPQNLAVPPTAVRKRGSVASMAGSLFRFPTYNSSKALDMEGDQEQFDEQLINVLDTVGTWRILFLETWT
jgi:hypothetical protein